MGVLLELSPKLRDEGIFGGKLGIFGGKLRIHVCKLRTHVCKLRILGSNLGTHVCNYKFFFFYLIRE